MWGKGFLAFPQPIFNFLTFCMCGMGLVRITSWYPNFNGSHFGLPPSEIHRMTGLPPKIVWTMTYSHRPHWQQQVSSHFSTHSSELENQTKNSLQFFNVWNFCKPSFPYINSTDAENSLLSLTFSSHFLTLKFHGVYWMTVFSVSIQHHLTSLNTCYCRINFIAP